MLVIDLAKKLNELKIPYAIVGGYALAFQGIVRATMDVDLMVSLNVKSLTEVEKVMHSLGLKSRLPLIAKEIAEFREKYVEERNLIAWSFVDYTNPTRVVDILIHQDVKHIKKEIIKVHGVPIAVATKQSLLALKLAANRVEDQSDIIKLKEALNEKQKS